MNYNSHLTAICRKALPVPVRWLLSQRMIHGTVLDYGCGKCKELNDTVLSKMEGVQSVVSYDPFFHPESLAQPNNQWFDVVLCTYVLCTLPEREELDVLRAIRRRIKPSGVAFITVRNDEPTSGYGHSSKGTFQRKVIMPYLYELRTTSQYRIFVLTRTTELPII